ncbi:LysR family transcriptional regulator [Aestuariispira insulae]|uniref:DNA-binding transcriptional LysR family regulator n=1 Tax=Aestuariispira insulae TaxID=1461337 RepID=A0A3D9HJS3_9PROT|nr:LysR family transcriptional regulator [Aestuariispira insulae]RED49740.1 DNA-binding transcriptional LysR family regulator [Aestuariispira insulae]
MDVTLARTFLAVVETGSFMEAANHVHVTQSTVSMRIKTLEEQLGQSLFDRSKAGASLTAVGRRFQRHALSMVRVWEQARIEVALPPGYQSALTVGGQFSLWDGFLLKWLALSRTDAPEIAIRTQIGFSDALMQRLIEGNLDLAIIYTPQSRPGFRIEKLFEEELVLVSSAPQTTEPPGPNYIYIDWGPEFQADHSQFFPEISIPGIYMELGSLGLKYLLENPASGYFPHRLAKPLLDQGRLQLVEGAPRFNYPAYAVYPKDSEQNALAKILPPLRQAAGET